MEHPDNLITFDDDEQEGGTHSWATITPFQARHILNSTVHYMEMCQYYEDDDSEGVIDDEERIQDCIDDNCPIVVDPKNYADYRIMVVEEFKESTPLEDYPLHLEHGNIAIKVHVHNTLEGNS